MGIIYIYVHIYGSPNRNNAVSLSVWIIYVALFRECILECTFAIEMAILHLLWCHMTYLYCLEVILLLLLRGETILKKNSSAKKPYDNFKILSKSYYTLLILLTFKKIIYFICKGISINMILNNSFTRPSIKKHFSYFCPKKLIVKITRPSAKKVINPLRPHTCTCTSLHTYWVVATVAPP